MLTAHLFHCSLKRVRSVANLDTDGESRIAYFNGCVILLHIPVAEDSLGHEPEQGVRESRTQIRKAALTLGSVFSL